MKGSLNSSRESQGVGVVASSASPIEKGTIEIPKGVPSLRAGEGNSFLLRRLHSLSGIIPIGAFLVEHFISNSEATNGVQAYNEQVKFLTSLPFVHAMEWLFIFLPLLYHGLYGFYIWYRGDSNVGDYPWTGNWLYTSQRWTGAIAFVYIVYHVVDMRFTGVHLMGGGYNAAFSKVWFEFQNPWTVAFYVIGIVAASWHFAYGVWLFCAKWGITVGERARKRLGYVCLALAIALVGIGLWTITGFVRTPADQVPIIEHD
jgi:succinate dehydrogenase / fumarate reductase cytochrome b subunit